ncbi:dirigent protein 1-like [Salvia hispanica]|uniref:dirigent protein 1-like n=1 Tax=Salvia hispanica TaxID=49212 RepID=UPI0020093AFE|nr:dirigent protein 1-like [Salvia hispanica]
MRWRKLSMEKLKFILTLMLIISLSSEAHIVSETKKMTRLHFYLHDVIGGDRPTVWGVAQCNLTDVLPSSFGRVMVLDNLVTSGPDPDSEEVGRMQGTVGQADLHEKALVMLLNLVFTKGEFEGSTLSILGRNPLAAESREVPIVAGTGAFRMATGYIISSTYYNDPARVRNVYEYNAVVYHMDPNVVSLRR